MTSPHLDDYQLEDRNLVVYDGVCNFCNSAVNFIIQRDPQKKFVFTPMQSQLANAVMRQHRLDSQGIDTLLLVKNGQCLVFSSAALEIAKDLSGHWYLFNVFRLVPAPIRDFIYKLFARHRYTLFGRQAECVLPSTEVRERFLGMANIAPD